MESRELGLMSLQEQTGYAADGHADVSDNEYDNGPQDHIARRSLKGWSDCPWSLDYNDSYNASINAAGRSSMRIYPWERFIT